MLPLESRTARQSHPRPSSPRNRRTKTLTAPGSAGSRRQRFSTSPLGRNTLTAVGSAMTMIFLVDCAFSLKNSTHVSHGGLVTPMACTDPTERSYTWRSAWDASYWPCTPPVRGLSDGSLPLASSAAVSASVLCTPAYVPTLWPAATFSIMAFCSGDSFSFSLALKSDLVPQPLIAGIPPPWATVFSGSEPSSADGLSLLAR